jgi:hypothetical protein
LRLSMMPGQRTSQPADGFMAMIADNRAKNYDRA